LITDPPSSTVATTGGSGWSWRAACDLLFHPTRFFQTISIGRGRVWLVAVLALGVSTTIARIDQNMLRADLGRPRPGWQTVEPYVTQSWIGFWIFVLAFGVISAIAQWYLWGWWYTVRLRWSGAVDADRRTARLVLIFAAAVWSVPSVVWAVISTVVYPHHRAAWESTTIWALLLVPFLFWSVVVSYKGVRATFPVRPRAARTWFLMLPLVAYAFGLLAAVSAVPMRSITRDEPTSTSNADESIPAAAQSLHQQARQAGAAGRYEEALAHLTRAAELAPRWPYPVYDRAFTHLLMHNSGAALADYRRTIELAPRGFFTALTAIDTLEREEQGEFPRGLYLEFVKLEGVRDPAERRVQLQNYVERNPRFAPAWSKLANLADNKVDRLRAIGNGLAANPDPETKGMLQIDKALTLRGAGEGDEAERVLRQIVSDPRSTLATQAWAKMLLARDAR
jgi:hypothetical protein